MRKIFILAIAFSIGIIISPAFSQQDPDDPGIQDSIILGSTYIDSGVTFAGVPLYVVTDEDIAYLHMPISYASADSNIRPRLPGTYFPPITYWYAWDTIYQEEQYIDLLRIDFELDTISNDYLNTHGVRVQILTLPFVIRPTAPPQLVVLDSTWNPIRGSIEFCAINDTGYTCLTPAYQRGFLAIGPGVGVENEGQIPQLFSLNQNYPNPFNPQTNIAFSLNCNEKVSLVIYDLLGKRIRSLLESRLESGSYLITWNGEDESGFDVASGTYLYRLTAGNMSQTKRMTLVR